jgi:hypothetical protein
VKKLIALAATLVLVIVVAWITIWHYKSERDKTETKLARQGEMLAAQNVEMEKIRKGHKYWTTVIVKSHSDSVAVASGDSLTFERLDSLPLRVIQSSKTVDFPLGVSPKPVLSSHHGNWIKIEIDSSAKSDSVRIEYHTWHANWSR